MKLAHLLTPWIDKLSIDTQVVGLQNDSRLIKPGDLFVAYPGVVTDGRLYMKQAAALGACAMVYDPIGLDSSFQCPPKIPCFPIADLAIELAALASRFYNNPSQSMFVTGVTGTNGKTTIAYQLAQAHELLQTPATYIGTLGQGTIHHLHPLNNTTPDALCLQRLFSQYQADNVSQVCMEVSSHALTDHRVDYIDFKEAIYTNLSHEHLDHHHTMEAYAAAKACLFARPTLQWVVLNQDDAFVGQMKQSIPRGCRIYTYGMKETSDVQALNCKITMNGSEFEVRDSQGITKVSIKSLGTFNIYNSLAIYTSLMAHGYSNDTIASVLTNLNPSPGRMEVVSKNPCVIVDYAHTPDALENVLKTLLHLKAKNLWVVFGCGGDRDKTKRPLMGHIASLYADRIILTSDNPRSEEPMEIINEIKTGLLPNIHAITIVDRKEAITHAFALAASDDIILIAGKGHEAYQQIGSERFVFSDQDVVRQLSLE